MMLYDIEVYNVNCVGMPTRLTSILAILCGVSGNTSKFRDLDEIKAFPFPMKIYLVLIFLSHPFQVS
jgi:hypothetical protein